MHSTIQREGFRREQILRNEQTSRVCLVETNGGRSADHSSPPGRRLMQTCVIIRTPFISPLMIAVPARACIVYLVESTNDMHWFFIHPLLNSCIVRVNAVQNGPNYDERCLPASALIKVSNWEEKSNQRPLVAFCTLPPKQLQRRGKKKTFPTATDWVWLPVGKIRRQHSQIRGPVVLLAKSFQRPPKNPRVTIARSFVSTLLQHLTVLPFPL